MAPTPGRDPNSDESQSKSENPFIRFRRFADAQIGSLLQGIIGLPSAMTKPAQTRWADFDEDMRRRDELQAKQKELRDSEARRREQPGEDEEVAIPVKKSPDWTPSSASTNVQPLQENKRGTEDQLEKDVPLYAPVTKALFAQLGQLHNHDREWDEAQHPSWELLSMSSMLRQDLISSFADPMNVLRDMIYDDLNASPLLRSNYSLLPYLLFSHYSPLKLSSTMPYGSQYCDAFEDLILTSQGRPMLSPFERMLGRRHLLDIEPFSILHNNPSASLALQNLAWLRQLRARQVLQQRETLTGRQASLARAWHSFSRPVWSPITPSMDMDNHQASKTESQPESEQDMYDRFLNWASLPVVFEKAQEFIEQQLKALSQHEAEPRSADPSTQNNNDSKASETHETLPSLPEILHRVLTILDPIPTHPPPNHSFETGDKSSTTTDQEPDVVSTTTTSERILNEDGSVKTSVTVWKRFADGRESVTKTTCVEDGERVWNRDDDEIVDDQRKVEWEEEDEQEGKKVDKDKKGWFWS